MNKEKLRIVFMGTPDFAVATLKALVDNNYNIVGVITAPDKPAGRGRKLNESAVKKYAVSNGLNLLQPTNLKSEAFINELEQLNANLQIVVAFRMLPKVVWDMPKFGTFNLHASLLPDYRGAAPIHWAVINGETITGVTTFFIDEKIDTGAMILQEKVNIAEDDTVGVLHDRLMNTGSALVIKTVELIREDAVETTIQPKSDDLKTAYKLNKENCRIDWSENVDKVYNKIRGLNPFPAAWCYLINGEEKLSVKLFGVTMESDTHNLNQGTITISKNKLKVAVPGGYINVIEIQLPGKRKMDVKSLLNGYKFEENAKML
ncbi:methionyl-tRNA formyltransferase [Psychroserpens sp.]|uniref:methionyl-tRNA formyltransferase n=1 Tax=Psychroserpens sp. TaxID=2020870 RepID=UPI001B2F62DB|nr:methionyl-tRNA formyltransferase [Psychroserpens sp.]MBO6607563.1 methionyl-tRNA formyltransferase [Psychroserpens sp.]MBO6655223.1 methionyl-tRNA formyltransferase [Psychroserpens sp.]MBO6683187.1 methionyl-tRNA formyltransferase [Psychroserpens sp.]MBO6749751.1 methionyl-tRNA formyltransferase [Psychroserpens sp.]MBO6916675.1 methionyl-tRNA formyltransferase [Psychroserpens sp.]